MYKFFAVFASFLCWKNSESYYFRESSSSTQFFEKDQLKYLNCSGFINNSSSAIDNYLNYGRLRFIPGKMIEVPMDCGSITKRVSNNQKFYGSLRSPIAFIRNVYTLYEFQEMLLSSIYHPSNTYCYSVDKKSKTGIFEKLQKLTRCLPNIILNPMRYDFDSSGHFQNRAHFKCLELILDRKWGHVIFLQNNDLILKPVEELAELSNLLNYTSIMSIREPFEDRYIHNADWTPAGLKLFKSELGVSKDILDKPLKIWKGLNQMILSRSFVKSIFEKLNLEGIMNLFDQKEIYGVDEMLVQTLYRNNLGLDGQPTSNCNNTVQDTIGRWTDWIFEGPSGYNEFCRSKLERNYICVMGVEYLADFKTSKFVIANKILENFDLAPLFCMDEVLREKKIWISKVELRNYPQFREMEMKENGTYDEDNFDCNLDF
ncbi:unnamed protein product [Caenorhabditis angaria]|uniref:Uncharacterized protein n=1 Tax=Caenorhabditis angaria TaxID=860376 RepID=A0A9P1IYR2_9PELO|nr:unnamed protein product [Caenorhabditis angaria]